METDMNDDDFIINLDDLVHSTTTSTVTVSEPTVDISGIVDMSSNIDWADISITTTPDVHKIVRYDIRDGGKIPLDIWAKLYNNGIIDDDEYLPF